MKDVIQTICLVLLSAGHLALCICVRYFNADTRSLFEETKAALAKDEQLLAKAQEERAAASEYYKGAEEFFLLTKDLLDIE